MGDVLHGTSLGVKCLRVLLSKSNLHSNTGGQPQQMSTGISLAVLARHCCQRAVAVELVEEKAMSVLLSLWMWVLVFDSMPSTCPSFQLSPRTTAMAALKHPKVVGGYSIGVIFLDYLLKAKASNSLSASAATASQRQFKFT